MVRTVFKYVGRALLVLLLTVVILVGTLYVAIYRCCNGPSEAAKELFITTILETGQLKFLASWVCSDEEIQAVVNKNTMEAMDTNSDFSLITIQTDDGTEGGEVVTDSTEEFDENGIRIEEISGRSFFAKMMIIKDPSKVSVGTVYDNGWPTNGKDLDQIISGAGGIGGVNGGLYVSAGNKGGTPMGLVVQNGQITFNSPSGLEGLYLIGMNNDNLLVIKDMSGFSAADVESYVAEAGIRDAVAFQEESSDSNNHFVPLVIDGKGRELNGQGSGANPRTAIGQRADGAILLLVTDGRGASGHLGATAADLISVMLDYGAINAANVDGGSSSSMYYDGNYEMTSVTFYYSNSSWKLPTAFVVSK